MSDSSEAGEVVQGNVAEPRPDPWSPPAANFAQAASIAAGIAGAATLSGESTSGTDDLAMLANPAQLFHVLGASLDASDARTWGLALVVLSVLLNILSFWLRYKYAGELKEKWDRWEEALRLRGGGGLARARSGKGLISQG
ncbi:MAG TPA: hypothetical protein VJ885_10885 [Thermoanaerobaculia bacterium]|nr:hypothetical protein [Thermoanaerobaculia bacterium]